MAELLVLIVVAVFAGVAVALQAQFMGLMDRSVGTAASVLATYGGGAVIATLIWAVRRSPFQNAREVPVYAWTAGALGLIIVGGIGYAAPRLGLSRTIVLTVAAQLAAAAVIDHFGFFAAAQRSFDLTRAAGFALTIAGVWLIVKQ